jgi:hypothetical protein
MDDMLVPTGFMQTLQGGNSNNSIPGFFPPGTRYNSTAPLPSPTPDPLTEKYRAMLKEDACSYLYDLSGYLRTQFDASDPIREVSSFSKHISIHPVGYI